MYKSKPIFKWMFIFIALSVLFSDCFAAYKQVQLTDKVTVKGEYVSFDSLAGWSEEDHDLVLKMYQKECADKKLPKLLKDLCQKAARTEDAKLFFETNFRLFKLYEDPTAENLLTGYYEPQFYGSLHKSQEFHVPLYKRPQDLVSLDVQRYPEFKSYKYLGQMSKDGAVAYHSRREINQGAIKEQPICYLKSEIDRFFLQVQGSGRIVLEDKSVMFVGYDGQNGHPYRSIGKAFVAAGEIAQEDISLQSIRKWLDAHPDKAQTVLESNPSFVFFNRRSRAASGAFGLELTPQRSVAVDKRHMALGYPLFIEAENTLTKKPIQKIVFAQDTGGAIRGGVRADLFCGFGREAEEMAGAMNAPLRMYVLIPR